MEEARLAMVSLKVWRQDGARHVQLEGEWENVIAALLDCDALIVTVNETRPATDA